jgi:MFS superfamily sulfate permease-like transporter
MNGHSHRFASRLGRVAQWVPALGWLRSYERSWFRADLIAGVTLAAYLLPAGIGDASLANLPPEAGLYACLFSGLVFWLFCSFRHTAITVTSAISLLVGASLADLAGGDTTRFGALAAVAALLVALIAFIAWVDHVRDVILEGVRTHPVAPKLVVIDFSSSPYIDLQSVQTLGALADELAASGIAVQAVEARANVRDRLRADGVDGKFGGVNRFTSLADVVDAFQQGKPT